ncbi:glycosyltransferase family 4 protein [Lentibacillus sp. N15]|uniref:glycosyltransferase family 4 protein n=1 Tax=Lentibacillus songyuanensis TaxID=3136161 RepID=UPI0031BACE6A
MKQVYFATRVRGFFKHLFDTPKLGHKFIYSNSKYYEVNGGKRKLLSRVAKMRVFDLLGLIQVISSKNKNCDIYGSSNRFLNVDKPYFIYLENPTALFHYNLERGKGKIGKKKLQQLLNTDTLKAVICMSNACYSTFEKLCGEFKGEKKLIYPYVPRNQKATYKQIHERCFKKEFNLLFVAQGSAFISKGALEIIETFKTLRKQGMIDVNLTILTTVNEIDSKLIQEIKSINGITLLDFKLTYEEMEDLYINSSVLLHPTNQDSFALVVLEGMKAALPIIATKLYAIPEMVKEGQNGFLIEPKYWFFDEENIPNPSVWNNRKKTIFSKDIDKATVQFLIEKICFLYEEREVLERMSLESLRIANSSPFDEDTITSQWNDTISQLG